MSENGPLSDAKLLPLYHADGVVSLLDYNLLKQYNLHLITDLPAKDDLLTGDS